MIKVTSSNIAGYDYDPDEQILTIEFNSGRTYIYPSVPAEIFDGLNNTVNDGGSVGRYFAANIRPNFAAVETMGLD